MWKGTEPAWPTRLLSLLAGAAVAELVLLRTATRTLIHIPGLARFEVPIRVVAEVGRFAYYLAVVALVATMVVWASLSLLHRDLRHTVRGAAVTAFVVTAAGGQLDLLTAPVVGGSLLALIVVVVTTMRPGLQAVPAALFVIASLAAALPVLGQGGAAAVSGRQVDGLMLAAEIALLLAAVTAPLLLRSRPGPTAIRAGAVAMVLTAGAFAAGSSTVSILVLWNMGVSGWMPGLVYALAAASLTTTLWSAWGSGARLICAGLTLLIAGGIGTISTYQTGLVLMGLVVVAQGIRTQVARPDGAPEGPDRRFDRFEIPPALAHSATSAGDADSRWHS